jgi:ribosomal protein S18 acetylase RimI-like enzyme
VILWSNDLAHERKLTSHFLENQPQKMMSKPLTFFDLDNIDSDLEEANKLAIHRFVIKHIYFIELQYFQNMKVSLVVVPDKEKGLFLYQGQQWELVGVACWNVKERIPWQMEDDIPYGFHYLAYLAVSEKWRRQKIAQTLLERIFLKVGETWALHTGRENVFAQRLYEKCGFQKQHSQSSEQHSILMIKF